MCLPHRVGRLPLVMLYASTELDLPSSCYRAEAAKSLHPAFVCQPSEVAGNGKKEPLAPVLPHRPSLPCCKWRVMPLIPIPILGLPLQVGGGKQPPSLVLALVFAHPREPHASGDLAQPSCGPQSPGLPCCMGVDGFPTPPLCSWGISQPQPHWREGRAVPYLGSRGATHM